MKTVTCKDMGGSCDAEIHGSTADEMMNNGAAHVKELAEQGDEDHKKILDMMNETMTDPAKTEAWNAEFTAKFDALPVSE